MASTFRMFVVVAALAIAVCFLGEVQSQVTFSRDWNPGKRGEGDIRGAIKTASTVCHLLMNQIRQLASCENRDELDPASSTIFNGGGR